MKFTLLSVLALSVYAAPAFANITVSSPAGGASVVAPFSLIATATPCSSQAIASMGYSLDNSSNTTIVNGASVNAQVSGAVGAHVVHVKSWGNQGASCVADIPITIVQPAPSSGNSAAVSVTVTSPAAGSTVVAPFPLLATAAPCSSQPVASMGYSLDDNATTTVVNGASLNAQVAVPVGTHVLHVKSWGNQGASCVMDVPLTIAASPAASIPPNAIAVSGIHALKNWQAEFDSGTGSGSASGAMSLIKSPSLSGTSRQFVTTYTNYGGERYSINFGNDANATNFLYDGWIYLTSPTNDVANIEMDLNQVMPNGQTAIFGFQCDGWSNTWDYTTNTGTPQNPVDQWMHTTVSCNPRNWSTNAWHHTQILFSRDEAGNVTYHTVWLDGVQQDIGVTAPSAFALGWAPAALLTNFQVDGIGAYGSATAYLDNLTVYRW